MFIGVYLSDVKRQANKVKLDCNLAVIRDQRIIENRIIARSTLASAELVPPNLQGFFYIKKKRLSMAEKRYYWLKLKEDYFNSPKIKKLRKLAGGDTMTIIYLKLQLLTLQNGGIYRFERVEDTIAEELALVLDEDVGNVDMTLSYFAAQNLIVTTDNENEIALLEVVENTGSEQASAERVRKMRERQALQCNGGVTQPLISNSLSNIYISSNKDTKSTDSIKPATKHKAYGEYKKVLLTDKQYEELVAKYGEEKLLKAITKVDLYCASKGKAYKNYKAVIEKWGIEENAQQQEQKSKLATYDWNF